jgi:hypothetical protein
MYGGKIGVEPRSACCSACGKEGDLGRVVLVCAVNLSVGRAAAELPAVLGYVAV